MSCSSFRILEVARCSQLTDVGFTTLARVSVLFILCFQTETKILLTFVYIQNWDWDYPAEMFLWPQAQVGLRPFTSYVKAAVSSCFLGMFSYVLMYLQKTQERKTASQTKPSDLTQKKKTTFNKGPVFISKNELNWFIFGEWNLVHNWKWTSLS